MIKENKCLYCYKPLGGDEKDFHAKCSQKFFGQRIPPEVEFGKNDLESLALTVLRSSVSVTGVQPKLSVDIEGTGSQPKRLTIVGLWGSYIFKPPSDLYPQMPETEDLTMHLAGIVGIKTAGHSLIRIKSGELAYITKRFDRIKKEKLPLEDMAQLTGVLTERKYKSSMEKIGKAIKTYSTNSGNEVLTFFELTLFSFITGNSDMHLKNFSLLTEKDGDVVLSPAYDLLATKLLLTEDREELALTLNGKKSRFRKSDFDGFAAFLKINESARDNVYKRFRKALPSMLEFVDISFLNAELKNSYKELLIERMNRIS